MDYWKDDKADSFVLAAVGVANGIDVDPIERYARGKRVFDVNLTVTLQWAT